MTYSSVCPGQSAQAQSPALDTDYCYRTANYLLDRSGTKKSAYDFVYEQSARAAARDDVAALETWSAVKRYMAVLGWDKAK